MKKAVVIGFANLYSMPFAKKYIKALEDAKMPYDMIFWDREELNEEGENYYVFKKKIDSSINVALKLRSFFEFKRFALDVLTKNQYEKIIVLYSLPAVLLMKYLRRNYKNNYVFVYTDYTFEKNPIYRRWLKTVARNACFTTVTSEGFLRYLPAGQNIYISHNAANLEERLPQDGEVSKPIRISYIGLLRQFAHIKKFVMRMANDGRFALDYYGNGFCEEELKSLVESNAINNVHVRGRYEPEDKLKLIGECDVINNCLANDKFQKYAMTNRFYDAVFNFKPQIVNAGSYSSEAAEGGGLGLAVNLEDEKLADKIYDWYINLDREKLNENCGKYIVSVKKDEELLADKLKEYLTL